MSGPLERYPDPRECDTELYKSLVDLPDGAMLNLGWVQANLWSQGRAMRIPESGVQRGMQSNLFLLEVEGEEESRRFLVKRIVPKELPSKASTEIWIEFVKSVRREIEFYSNLQKSENQPIRSLFPKVYYSMGTPPHLDTRPLETAFVLIMEDLSESYHQSAMMNKSQAKSVMKSLARFHAHFWNSESACTERGGFWTLSRRRRHQEIEKSEETWLNFLQRFPQLQNQEDLRPLGKLIQEKSEFLDDWVEKGACTRIHGDAKGWNFFFGGSGSEHPFLFIDLQWTGRGHPLQDVAYALTTTLSTEVLDSMDELVDFYVAVLQEELVEQGLEIPSQLRSTFDYVWLDYVRVVFTGLWKNLSPESIDSNKTKIGPSMINRSWEHVVFIINRASKLLKTL